MSSTEDWNISCLSDDDGIEPTLDELDTMYQRLASGEKIELIWKCSGRRLPTPINIAKAEVKKDSNAEAKNLEFDFMDEVAVPTMRVRGPSSNVKTAIKKKTASFASVLDAMKKNNKRTFQSPKS